MADASSLSGGAPEFQLIQGRAINVANEILDKLAEYEKRASNTDLQVVIEEEGKDGQTIFRRGPDSSDHIPWVDDLVTKLCDYLSTLGLTADAEAIHQTFLFRKRAHNSRPLSPRSDEKWDEWAADDLEVWYLTETLCRNVRTVMAFLHEATVANKKVGRSGRKEADPEAIKREAQIAKDWRRARGSGVIKAAFAKERGMTVVQFGRLLDRVDKRNRRSDK